jgi:catechol 2,3-dioxygenase-like lactoylglutathione lyase family enzyme
MHVDDLAKNIAFYSKLFGSEPSRVESDYAKWMLEDPALNFAISARGGGQGIDHLGFQTDDPRELDAMKAKANAADMALADEGETTCCYARSDKYWITDPQGVAWEQFHTLESIPVFSESTAASAAACCAAIDTSTANDVAAVADASAQCCAPRSRGKPLPVSVKAARCC